MSTEAWRNENTTILKVRLLNESDLFKAFQQMQHDTGLSTSGLLRQILSDRLAADGYMEVSDNGQQENGTGLSVGEEGCETVQPKNPTRHGRPRKTGRSIAENREKSK